MNSELTYDKLHRNKLKTVLTSGRVCIAYSEKGRSHTSMRSNDISEGCSKAKTRPSRLNKIYRVVIQRRGIFWAFAFSVLCSFVSLSIKLLSGRVSPNQIMVYRSCALILATVPNLVRHRVSFRLPLKTWCLLVLRCSSGNSCALILYYSLQQLDISTVKCIMQSATVITCIFSCICLKEACSVIIGISCCVSVAGVLLVVQPSAIFGGLGVGETNVFGLLAAFASAILMSLTYISVRVLGRFKVNAQLINFVFGCIGLAVSFIVLTALNEWSIPRCGSDRLIILAVGVMGYLQIMTITIALKTENAAVVAVIATAGVFVTFVLDYAFFDSTPNIWKALGALCITVSSAGASISSHYTAKRNLSQNNIDDTKNSR